MRVVPVRLNGARTAKFANVIRLWAVRDEHAQPPHRNPDKDFALRSGVLALLVGGGGR